VKFASEFDALEVVTDELKSKLTPVSSRLKAIEKERAERRKVRKRTKVAQEASSSSSRPAEESTDVEMEPASDVPGDLEEESVYRARELQELEGLADADLKNDYGCSMTGLYDLVGACRCCSALGAN
jgi:ubiquitin carboxyl-terminal hydrolase 14